MTITTAQADVMQKIKQLAKGRKVVLNVGCGEDNPERLHPYFRDEKSWFELRLDANARVEPHILGDLTDLSMLPDGAVNAVLSSHNLEHLHAHQVADALAGFYRVLGWGGELLVLTPDMQTIAAIVAQAKLEQPLYTSPEGEVTPLDVMYGLSSKIAAGNHLMAHRTAFTPDTMINKLKAVGFSNLLVLRDRFDMEVHARKLPANHTQRKDGVSVKFTPRYNPREAVAVTVEHLDKLPHPGLLWPGKMPDELDVPPAALVSKSPESGVES